MTIKAIAVKFSALFDMTETKISQFGLAVLIQQYICRLQITVNNALVLHGIQNIKKDARCVYAWNGNRIREAS